MRRIQPKRFGVRTDAILLLRTDDLFNTRFGDKLSLQANGNSLKSRK